MNALRKYFLFLQDLAKRTLNFESVCRNARQGTMRKIGCRNRQSIHNAWSGKGWWSDVEHQRTISSTGLSRLNQQTAFRGTGTTMDKKEELNGPAHHFVLSIRKERRPSRNQCPVISRANEAFVQISEVHSLTFRGFLLKENDRERRVFFSPSNLPSED